MLPLLVLVGLFIAAGVTTGVGGAFDDYTAALRALLDPGGKE